MTNIRSTGEVKGTVFDLPHAMSLSNEDCNVLLVSSRTLFFIQSFGLGEVTFQSRYASSFLSGARYVIAQDQADFDDINDIINNYGLEAIEVTCEIVGAINGVQQAILTATSNACACGTVGETLEASSGIPGGPPPEGFGEPDPAIVDRICKAANAIHTSMVDVITELDDSPVEGFLFLGFGVISGLVSAIIASAFIPIVGQLVVAVAGIVVSVSLALLAVGLDLAGLKAELIASNEALICALVNSLSAEDAKAAYLLVLTDAGQSAVNVALIDALMTINTVDLLYFSTPDSEAFLATFIPDFDCSSCSKLFEFTFGTGTFLYDDTEFTLSSEPNAGFHSIAFVLSNVPCPTGNWCLEFTNNNTTPGGGFFRRVQNYRNLSCGTAENVFSGGYPPLFTPVLVGDVALNNPTPFTANFKIKPVFRGLGDGTTPYSGTNDCV